jgi:hypothetical protein
MKSFILGLAKKLGWKEKLEYYENDKQWPAAIGLIAAYLSGAGINKLSISVAALIVFITFFRTTLFPIKPAELDKIKKRLEKEEKVEKQKEIEKSTKKEKEIEKEKENSLVNFKYPWQS